MIWSAVFVHLNGLAFSFQNLIHCSRAQVNSSIEQKTPRSSSRLLTAGASLLLHGCSCVRVKIARPGMIIFVSVSMFDHKPERCPFGHLLWPGMAQVRWKPCICTAAREADE